MKAITYSGSQKENAIALALKIGVRPAARQSGISRGTLKRWVKANAEFYAKLNKTIKG